MPAALLSLSDFILVFDAKRLGLGGVRGYSASKTKELKIHGIKHAIAVASAKGGVGKSTTAG